ncbi:MAG: ABC transporter substrate-binding protein [Pirellulaceae bacterium]|nr:ABC transporter substrate-binding protein [Pirellulaceae bacterium]
MKTRTRLLSVLAFLLLLLGIGWWVVTRNSSNEKATIKLQQEWFPYAGYAGECEAVRLAALENVVIELIPGSESVDPIKLVLSGAADFGVAGADLVISANEKGADLVCIGTINNVSPTCFLVKSESGIKSPTDFIGKKVGILPGTNTERVYNLLMARSSVDRSRIEEIPVPFDLQTFLLGQYDVRPAFIYDEPVSLDLKSITYDIIKPSDFGVKFVGTVYFTRKDFLSEHPEEVQILIDYLRKGWESAIANPTQAIDTLAIQFEGIDKDRELKSLERGMPYFSGEGGVLKSSPDNWQQTISGLEELGEIAKGKVSLGQILDESFLNKSMEK